MSNEETFLHVVEPWTVGQLREALAGLPDDLPISVWTTTTPGGSVEERVITDAGFGHINEGNGWREDRTRLDITTDFPTDEYHRAT